MFEPGMYSIDEPGREEVDPEFWILPIPIPNGFYIAMGGSGYELLKLLAEIVLPVVFHVR